MKVTFKMIAAAAVLSGAMAASSSAATLDFMAEANSYERGVTNGTTITFDGLDVTFTSSHFAYFDKGNAGLGVCMNMTATNQCNPANDDNLTVGETVTLSFDTAQNLSGLMFRAEGHIPLSDNRTLMFATNGGALTEYTFAALSGASFMDVSSATFGFGGSKPDQYYVQQITATPTVPLPATAPLALAGMGALAMMRRRRRAA
ncbi:VPLPA-CTERM sorting domain-containing protein [Paracoccus sp. (in: a-proteobacteria)]|uniref:VPLPA-CTERM sorting domain-containing protein n=1 Tax=Paracoccus sp. TaxID=267 RepID=UPI003A8AFF06